MKVNYGIVIFCCSIISLYGDQDNSIPVQDISEAFRGLFSLATEGDTENVLLWNSGILNNQKNLEDTVRFFSYSKTKNNLTVCQELKLNDTKSLKQAKVKRRKVVKLLIHGFRSNCTVEPFPQKIIEAYLQKYGKLYNVICVDWSKIAAPLGELSSIVYTRSVRNINKVGEQGARFIAFLCDEKIIDDAKQVHIIGFSLGAHVAGIIGSEMKKTFNTKIGRITGLDPAGPSFQTSSIDSKYKLDNTDAKFVDVIHTNQGHLGIREKLGDVDFYPNGGERQPRCYTDLLKSFADSVLGSCSHRSSAIYYEQSIKSKKLIACECKSSRKFGKTLLTSNKCPRKQSVIFGENCPPRTRGSFCLEI